MNNDLKDAALNLKFKINQEVLSNIEKEFSIIVNKLEKLKKFEVGDVEPMTFVDESPITWMREDVVGDSLPIDVIIKNSPESDGAYIVLEKVVK